MANNLASYQFVYQFVHGRSAGMSWSGFRPSDDATKYGYNIPGNMYAVAALERAVQLNADVWQDADFKRAALHLVATMRCVFSTHFTSKRPFDGPQKRQCIEP